MCWLDACGSGAGGNPRPAFQFSPHPPKTIVCTVLRLPSYTQPPTCGGRYTYSVPLKIIPYYGEIEVLDFKEKDFYQRRVVCALKQGIVFLFKQDLHDRPRWSGGFAKALLAF